MDRFGKAFYVSVEGETAVAEVAASGKIPAQVIRFDFNASAAKVLDLTDPTVAAKWGYIRGPVTAETRAIGPKAIQAGYDAIKFPSERGAGANFAILRDFNAILTPKMVAPVPR